MKNQSIIKNNHDFQKIIGKRNIIKNSYFIINVSKNNESILRYGISVGKKLGNAPLRNKIKRQVRSMIKGLMDTYKSKSLDIIIVVRKNYINDDYSTINKSLEELFKKLSN